MWNGTVYLRSGCRQPVRVGLLLPGTDLQGAIPVSWCSRCGREVFAEGQALCPRCKAGERKGANDEDE